mgnify:CR=1 FL=1
MYIALIIAAALVLMLTIVLALAIAYRRVVPQNEVHSVQYGKKTVSYGKEMDAGNTYYAWPAWLPYFGVVTTTLPVSVFSLNLFDYEAYDSGRLPLIIDITAFFRIAESNLAAQRVSTFASLTEQLTSILQGVTRTILASKDIQAILAGRSEFGEAFTTEVTTQLSSWGVVPVKSIELMDIRDAKGSQVIHNIMEMKKSEIERDSRVEVAENRKQAEIAEIEARREADMSKQDAEKQVGVRTALKEQEVGQAKEVSLQAIAEQNKITQEKQIDIARIQQIGAANIQKESNVIKAEEKRLTDVINAEGEKQKTILAAEAELETQQRHAAGVRVNGEAAADAEKLILLAPVEAQITLAREIGDNEGYQAYLIKLEEIAANKAIGIEQASALKSADIKVIATGGAVDTGISSIGQLMSSKGGAAVAAALEGLSQTEAGKAVVDKLTR